jgi:hypothetical protein
MMEQSFRVSGAAHAGAVIASLTLWASIGFGIVAAIHHF